MRLKQLFEKLPSVFTSLRISLDKNKGTSVNLYFQDESRFGLKTHVGRCLTARGLKPIVKYKHQFASTYLYGSYSPLDGDSFVWEINGVNNSIFEAYLEAFSNHQPDEHKIVVIDNAGFHATKHIHVPVNISLLRIPPYTPELNPCEKIWHYIKQRFKNKLFESMDELNSWLHIQVSQMTKNQIKSITHNQKYLSAFNAAFNT